MNNLTIVIPGNPMAKQRARHSRNGAVYSPQKLDIVRMKREIRMRLPEGFEMFEQGYPVIVNAVFFFEPSKSKTTKKFLKQIESEDVPHTQKPDRDNCDKFLLDSMNKIVIHDDCQVYDGRLSKFWSKNPRTEIEIIWSQNER